MGKIDWNNKISKKQHFQANGYKKSPSWGEYRHTSFTWVNHDEDIILLFNDHESNVALDKELIDTKSTSSNLFSCLNAVRIDDTGVMERKQIFNSAIYRVKIFPACSKVLNKERTELVLIGFYRKKARLAHLIVE